MRKSIGIHETISQAVLGLQSSFARMTQHFLMCLQGCPATVLRVLSWKFHSTSGLPLTESQLMGPRLSLPGGIQMSSLGKLWVALPLGSSSRSTMNDWNSLEQTAESQIVEEMKELPHPEGLIQARHDAGISQQVPSPTRAEAMFAFFTIVSQGLAKQLSILAAHSSNKQTVWGHCWHCHFISEETEAR